MPKKLQNKRLKLKRKIQRITNNNKNRLSVTVVLNKKDGVRRRKKKKQFDDAKQSDEMQSIPMQNIPISRSQNIFHQPLLSMQSIPMSADSVKGQLLIDQLGSTKDKRLLDKVETIKLEDLRKPIKSESDLRNPIKEPIESKIPELEFKNYNDIFGADADADTDDEMQYIMRKPSKKSNLTKEEKREYNKLIENYKEFMRTMPEFKDKDIILTKEIRKSLNLKSRSSKTLLKALRKNLKKD